MDTAYPKTAVMRTELLVNLIGRIENQIEEPNSEKLRKKIFKEIKKHCSINISKNTASEKSHMVRLCEISQIANSLPIDKGGIQYEFDATYSKLISHQGTVLLNIDYSDNISIVEDCCYIGKEEKIITNPKMENDIYPVYTGPFLMERMEWESFVSGVQSYIGMDHNYRAMNKKHVHIFIKNLFENKYIRYPRHPEEWIAEHKIYLNYDSEEKLRRSIIDRYDQESDYHYDLEGIILSLHKRIKMHNY